MKNFLAIGISLTIIAITNYMGHTAPPFSIMSLPFVIPAISAVILYGTNFRPNIKLFILAMLIVINDILIKLYAGGAHDQEGLGFITFFFLIGFFISFIWTIIYLDNQYGKFKEFVLPILIYLLIIFCSLVITHDLNMPQVEKPSHTPEMARRKGTLIEEYQLSTNNITLGDKNIELKKAWTERMIEKTNFIFYNREVILPRKHFVLSYSMQTTDSITGSFSSWRLTGMPWEEMINFRDSLMQTSVSEVGTIDSILFTHRKLRDEKEDSAYVQIFQMNKSLYKPEGNKK